MLLTTQSLDEAEQLADRIAILHEGRILVSGTLAELKARCLRPGWSTSSGSPASRRSSWRSSVARPVPGAP
ncbi:MAG TPA: hypothetical protein VFJ85_16010 [Acidimicrobiales bacterium]|nr:hypothetical protein [Acidimicrobiales bacterium]